MPREGSGDEEPLPREVEVAIRKLTREKVDALRPEIYIIINKETVICRYCFLFAASIIIGLAAALAVVGKMATHLPLIFGFALLAVGIVLTFSYSTHTPLQRQIILAVVALGGSSVATELITGALQIQLTLGKQTAITASGALAIFVILYFFSAATPKE